MPTSLRSLLRGLKPHGNAWSDDRERLVTMVQFIGGGPTLHADLPKLVRHALARGLMVEVFSNLVHVTPLLGEVFSPPGVRLATSYYTDDPARHEAITTKRGTYARTKVKYSEALRRSIPLRVGVIDTHYGQRVEQAVAELKALGVTDIGIDNLRQVGRGVRDDKPGVDQLCGGCARGKVAVASNGEI